MSSNSNWVYTEKVKEHFMHPKNVLKDNESFSADAEGIVGNVKCGDQMMMAIKVDPVTRKITDCRWKTYGCASAIASTSVLSEMIKGKNIEEAYKITPKEIMAELEGLPEHKIHCSVLGDKALRSAIDSYYKLHGMKEKVERQEATVVCHCMNVTDHEIEEAVLEGVKNYCQLQEKTKIGTVCGQCRETAESLIEEYKREHFS